MIHAHPCDTRCAQRDHRTPGPAERGGRNITVSFPDYVKNVASSEIYPTWEPVKAIEANILAIVSFALNRVYTEFYPSRG